MKLNIDNYKQISEFIYVVENFIPEDLCKSLVQLAENHVGWLPREKDSELWKKDESHFWRNKIGPDIPDDISEMIIKKQENLFYDQFYAGLSKSIFRMLEGDSLIPHPDNPGLDLEFGPGKYTEDMSVVWGLVIYLSNFEGGEIYYPKLNLDYKPKLGDLVIHPANKKHMHGTRAVIGDDPRYTITSFMSIPYMERKIQLF